jgi:hypothetical protein
VVFIYIRHSICISVTDVIIVSVDHMSLLPQGHESLCTIKPVDDNFVYILYVNELCTCKSRQLNLFVLFPNSELDITVYEIEICGVYIGYV